MRIYDKGLERRLGIPRVWERAEAELRKDLADASWLAIVAGGEEWAKVAFEYLVGVVDFRVPTTRHATIDERARPAWWNEFCSSVDGVRAQIQRQPTDAHGFLDWVARCVFPTIESIRQRAGLDTLSEVWEAIEWYFAGQKPGGSDVVVRELIDIMNLERPASTISRVLRSCE